MYNLQKAKDDIDAVAKHAIELTEHVIAIGETLQALSTNLEAKLEGLSKELHGSMDRKLEEVRKAVLGNDGPLVETTAIADLGAKLSALKNNRLALTRPEQAGTETIGEPHAPEHPHQDYHENHGG